MCGIAEVLLNQGYEISGSDINESVTTKHLQALGAVVFVGHRASNVEQANVIVVSSAINEENPEIIAARKNRIPPAAY